MNVRQKFATANRIRKESGWAGIRNKLKFLLRERREARNYQKWILKNKLTDADRAKISLQINELPHKPLFSIILPVYNVDEKWLRACLDSVFRQIYENWELCIADDKSPSPHIRKVLEEYAARDERVKVVFRAENGHISAASNSALELATGEFCVLLDHDDELTEDALFRLADELNRHPETDFIYSDEDMIDERGSRYAPNFKPDFSRDLFYSLNLMTHLSAFRTETLRAVGGFCVGLEGSQDYDLALRFIEQTDETRLRHIPRILYHWRAIRGSVALSSDEKPYAHERARIALNGHFERTGKKAKVVRGIHQLHRVRYELPEKLPRVSLILSAGTDSKTAEQVVKLLGETDYPDLETILICPNDSKKFYFSDDVKVFDHEKMSKTASLNRAASQATGEVLCFADADLLPLSEDWLRELVSFAIQKEIGAVGGKVLDAEEKIIGGGLILGSQDLIRVAHQGFPRDADGRLFRARVAGNFSAVTVNCLVVRRELFKDHDGFDAENFSDSLFDADFCLRLRESNLRVVFAPYAELTKTAKSGFRLQPTDGERDYFRRRWQSVIERDPFYNPNLSLEKETFTIRI